MSDRFVLNWAQVNPALSEFMRLADGFDTLLLDAYNAVTVKDWNATDVSQIRANIQAEVALADAIPWVFYDMLSKFVELAPSPIVNSIEGGFRIPTNRYGEYLRVTSNSRWQVVWSIENDTSSSLDGGSIALDWYLPPDQDNVPIVPTTILDYIAGSASLIKAGLILPAGALATIAIESALWDSLSETGFNGFEDLIEYESVTWSSRRTGNKLLIGVDGANRPLEEYSGEPGAIESFNLLRIHAPANAAKVKLQMQVPAEMVDFLSTSREKSRSHKSNRTLTTAFEKARRENLPCLNPIPSPLDKTLIGIRNNLVHLSTGDEFNEAIHLPSTDLITTFADIRSRPELMNTILLWSVALINEVYCP